MVNRSDVTRAKQSQVATSNMYRAMLTTTYCVDLCLLYVCSACDI